MSHIGYYLSEADITRSVYIKEEPQLESLGHFHEGIEIMAVLEGEVEAFHINRSERLKVGEIFFAIVLIVIIIVKFHNRYARLLLC